MPADIEHLRAEGEGLIRTIAAREIYIAVLEAENFKLKQERITVGGAKGLLVALISLMIAGLLSARNHLTA